jgi:hypothetical protein
MLFLILWIISNYLPKQQQTVNLLSTSSELRTNGIFKYDVIEFQVSRGQLLCIHLSEQGMSRLEKFKSLQGTVSQKTELFGNNYITTFW